MNEGEQLELFPELVNLWLEEARKIARIRQLIETADDYDY